MGVTCFQNSEKKNSREFYVEKYRAHPFPSESKGEERLEKERLEKERLEKERLEKERLEKERLEKERLEKERLEKERLEKEKFNNQISKWNYTNNGINNNANTAKKDKKKISSFIQNNEITTIVHKIDGMNEYIIEINITKLNKKLFHRIAEFIMILDVSGSMGSYVHNLVSNNTSRFKFATL